MQTKDENKGKTKLDLMCWKGHSPCWPKKLEELKTLKKEWVAAAEEKGLELASNVII